MFCFEVEIVIVGIRREANLLYFGNLAFRLHFLFLLLLIVEEFIVVDDLAHGWIHLWRDLNQVKFLVLRHLQCFLQRVDANFYVVANQSHLRGANVLVDPVLGLLAWNETSPESAFIKSATAGFLETSARWPVEPASGFLWYCHLFFLVKPLPEGGDKIIKKFPLRRSGKIIN